ncbi:MAG: porin family protein [Rhizobiales bacterium]|nr:porin family protein [Hyphomicrobiales bacterium]
MKKYVLAAACAAFATGAEAADLGAQRIAVPAAIVATGHDWTGFYAGLHAGYGWGTTKVDQSLLGGLPGAGIPDIRSQGALIGGQFGWNYQVGQFVLGLEATLAWASLSGSLTDGTGTLAIRSRTNWIATMGPRLGFAFDRALIYAKAGLATAGLETRVSLGAGGPGGGDISGSHVRGGWFVGAGVEYALSPNWSVKVEYNYIDLGGGFGMLAIPGAPAAFGIASSRTVHTVTAGFNYLFPVSRQAAIRSASVAEGGFDWTGFYLGVHAGYGRGSTTFDPALALLGGGPSPDHNESGVLLGGQFGWNYQINRFVLGLEATASWAGLSGSATVPGAPGGPLGGSVRSQVNWLATMGPRVGFTFDRALIYGKGGIAFAGLNTSADVLAGGPGFSTSARSARVGWSLGAGAEYAFAPNWSAKIEYNYHNFSSGYWLAALGPIAEGVRAKQDIHTVTLGVNYLFSSGPSAVVARY